MSCGLMTWDMETKGDIANTLYQQEAKEDADFVQCETKSDVTLSYS